MNEYTIVLLCECGCDTHEVHHVKSKSDSPMKVWRKFEKDHPLRSLRLLSVFEGFHTEIFSGEEVRK